MYPVLWPFPKTQTVQREVRKPKPKYNLKPSKTPPNPPQSRRVSHFTLTQEGHKIVQMDLPRAQPNQQRGSCIGSITNRMNMDNIISKPIWPSQPYILGHFRKEHGSRDGSLVISKNLYALPQIYKWAGQDRDILNTIKVQFSAS